MSDQLNTHILETERLILRPWVEADIEPFSAMGADPRVMEFFPGMMSYDDSASWPEKSNEQFSKKGFTWWAVEIPGVTSFAGFTGLSEPGYQMHFTPCIEVGWRLAYDYWGKGYASEAARASLKYGYEQCMLDEIVSFTTQTNKRSRTLMERLGMHHDEKDDFLHPNFPEEHHLRPHVLYRLSKSDWLQITT